jgi:hypothetical protein
VKSAKVLPRAQLLGDNSEERDAGPDGHGNILLNVISYRKKLKSNADISGLVQLIGHEYLIASGLEKKDSYDLSSSLMSALNSRQIDLAQLLGSPPHEHRYEWRYHYPTGRHAQLYCSEQEITPGQEYPMEIGEADPRFCLPCPDPVSEARFESSAYGTAEVGRVDIACALADDFARQEALGKCEAAGLVDCKVISLYNTERYPGYDGNAGGASCAGVCYKSARCETKVVVSGIEYWQKEQKLHCAE